MTRARSTVRRRVAILAAVLATIAVAAAVWSAPRPASAQPCWMMPEPPPGCVEPEPTPTTKKPTTTTSGPLVTVPPLNVPPTAAQPLSPKDIYVIRQAGTNVCVQVGANNRLVAAGCTYGFDQRFQVRSLGNGHIELRGRQAVNHCWDVEAARTTPTYINMYPCHGGTNQQFHWDWTFGAKGLAARVSNLCLKLEASMLRQGSCLGAANERFETIHIETLL